VGAGLDSRLTPFAGLYVLSMAIVGPILAVNSEKIGRVVFRRRTRRVANPERDRMRAEEIALVESVMAGNEVPEPAIPDEVVEQYPTEPARDAVEEQAAQQSDAVAERKRDPEY
jgi:CPA2 family monovalent cation:H+ antiporter-2